MNTKGQKKAQGKCNLDTPQVLFDLVFILNLIGFFHNFQHIHIVELVSAGPAFTLLYASDPNCIGDDLSRDFLSSEKRRD